MYDMYDMQHLYDTYDLCALYDLYDLYQLYDLATVVLSRGSRATCMIYVGRVSWVGSGLGRSCTTCMQFFCT